MSVLRDIFRRKGRSILTITGIGIAVFALVVLGAVAENMNVYVKQLVGYYENVVVVVEAEDANFVGMSLGSRPISTEVVDRLRTQAGVRAISPQVNLLLDDGATSVVPHMVLGARPESPDYERWKVKAGRALRTGDTRALVLGYDLAQTRKLGVGDTMEVHGTRFEIVGVLDRTYVNLLDSSVFVPLADAQQMYYDALPETFKGDVKPEELVLQVNVYAAGGQDPDALASAVNRDVDGVLATGPTKMMGTVNGLIGLINAVVWSVAAVALIASVVSIVNTMLMAVGERTREIGVKRALGATRWSVARDVVVESGTMGLLGGVGGLVIGVAVALGLNTVVVAMTGTTALVPTFRLGVTALVFALVLGAVGGLYPALHASRLDPATAIARQK